jgi:hypothetical protein
MALPCEVLTKRGPVDQLVRSLPCHGRGCGFEPRPDRFFIYKTGTEATQLLASRRGEKTAAMCEFPPAGGRRTPRGAGLREIFVRKFTCSRVPSY